MKCRWGVDAEEYSDTLWVSRRDFYRCFTENWPLGRQDMVVWSYYHYEIGKIKNANIAMDLCVTLRCIVALPPYPPLPQHSFTARTLSKHVPPPP